MRSISQLLQELQEIIADLWWGYRHLVGVREISWLILAILVVLFAMETR